MRKLPIALCLSVASLLAACGGGSGSDANHGAGPNGAGENGTFDPNNPLTIQLSGKYELSTAYDLTTAGVFPDIANTTLRALSDLKNNPSKAILDLLKAANVPIVATVLSVLPPEVQAPFEGWFNDAIFAALYQNVPVTKQIAGLIEDVASIATKFDVVSELDLPPTDAMGKADAKHALTGVAFTIMGNRTIIKAPELLTQATHAEHVAASAVHIVERSPDIENGRLALGDHGFGLPLGDFVSRGIDKLAQAKLNAPTLRDALGKAIDCTAIAETVGSKCVGPVCVGHKTEVRDLCVAGLDAVANQIHAELKLLNLDAVHLASGQGRMWDAPAPNGPMDGKIDRIDAGEWSAFLRLAKSEHPVVASFTGKRIGDMEGVAPSPGTPK